MKTLLADVFDRVDRLTAPRLVEYWEQDPCAQEHRTGLKAGTGKVLIEDSGNISLREPLVKIEARFTVAEYEIVILSARDSAALNRWLVSNKYRILDGAEPVLRPYVQAGSKFFVAKVRPQEGHSASAILP